MWTFNILATNKLFKTNEVSIKLAHILGTLKQRERKRETEPWAAISTHEIVMNPFYEVFPFSFWSHYLLMHWHFTLIAKKLFVHLNNHAFYFIYVYLHISTWKWWFFPSNFPLCKIVQSIQIVRENFLFYCETKTKIILWTEYVKSFGIVTNCDEYSNSWFLLSTWLLIFIRLVCS